MANIIRRIVISKPLQAEIYVEVPPGMSDPAIAGALARDLGIEVVDVEDPVPDDYKSVAVGYKIASSGQVFKVLKSFGLVWMPADEEE